MLSAQFLSCSLVGILDSELGEEHVLYYWILNHLAIHFLIAYSLNLPFISSFIASLCYFVIH